MLLQLDAISQALNAFQDDRNTLSDCVALWLSLIANLAIIAEVRERIEKRFDEVATPQHLLAPLVDHRRKAELQQAEGGTEATRGNWLSLNMELQHTARSFVAEQEDDFAVVLAAYETEDDTMFPETAFEKSLCELAPLKYWQYIGQIFTRASEKVLPSHDGYFCMPSFQCGS